MAQYRDPVVYTVGVDITEERYNEALLKIADWFAQSRKTDEPALLARRVLKECLDGRKADGTPWFGADHASLATRVRIKARFDLDTMKPLLTASEKTKRKKARAKERAKEKAAEDSMLPDEVAKVLGKNAAKYGDNPHIHLSTQEQQDWQRLHDGYLKQFPELRSINASSELKIVCDLQVLADRLRHKALQGQAVAVEELAKITKELATLKSALGIHADQIARRVKPKTDSTIGEASLRLEQLGDARELRARFFLEGLLQAYQQYVTPTADGLGYQLDEDLFFAETMCRTCACAKCGHRNVAGFSADEVEQTLVKRGLLEPLEDADAEAKSPALD